jgi:hypothetical protein
MSAAVPGRPIERWALPSYLLAISFRCQANSVSGATTGGDLSQNLAAQLLPLYSKSAALVITEPQSAVANLFSKHPIFFNQVIDDEVLMLVHPSGNGRDEE